jgi:hypothetical protein
MDSLNLLLHERIEEMILLLLLQMVIISGMVMKNSGTVVAG